MNTTYKDPLEKFDVEYVDVNAQNQVLQEVHGDTYPEVQNQAAKPKKEKNYGWAFFLCSLFLGLGGTATTENPMFLFGGLGIGFLFFVEPIYKKVINIFKDKI